MALFEFFVFLIYTLTNNIIYQPLSRVKVDGGVVFYGITSVGDPPQQVITFFEFDSPGIHYRNYPGNQAFNDKFMYDNLFGNVNQFKIANVKFSLPFAFDPFYFPFTRCGDIPCQLSIGMGRGSPIWNRYANISFGHLGITFNENSPISRVAHENAFDCKFNSTSVCDLDVQLTNMATGLVVGDHVDMRFGLDNDPVTYLPKNIFYAIKGSLVPKVNQVGDWPNIQFCDYNGHCFILFNDNILMSHNSYTELTIRPWSENYILVGTSFAENVQVYFFSRQSKVGFYVHHTVLDLSSWGMFMSVISALLFAYITTTSYNINNGVQKQIMSIKFRVIIDLAVVVMIPIIILCFTSFRIFMFDYSPTMFIFVCLTYFILTCLYLASYIDIIMGNFEADFQRRLERVDKAGMALVRNFTACTSAIFNIFCAFLEVYPGGEVEIFQFVFMFFYTTIVFFLFLNVLWFFLTLKNLKWGVLTAATALVFCTSNVSGMLLIVHPYITNNFGNDKMIRYLIIVVMIVFQIIFTLAGSILLHMPYLYYVRTGELPKLNDT